jgi:hypothetical protein
MGSGGNFAKKLDIDADGNLLAAKGPLDASDDNINIKLYAYVYQELPDGSGAVFTAELNEQGITNLAGTLASLGESADQWIIPRAKTGTAEQDGQPEQEGTFQPGPATGVAFTIARTPDEENPKTTVTWWAESVKLVRKGAASSEN